MEAPVCSAKSDGIGASAAGRSLAGDDVDIVALVSVIASGFSINPDAIVAPSRDKARIALTRQVAMYVAHVTFGLSLTRVGAKFGRDRTTAAHACRLIEDLRDDAGFDFALEHLELAAIRLTALSVTI